jgi:hypothetical protein
MPAFDHGITYGKMRISVKYCQPGMTGMSNFNQISTIHPLYLYLYIFNILLSYRQFEYPGKKHNNEIISSLAGLEKTG